MKMIKIHNTKNVILIGIFLMLLMVVMDSCQNINTKIKYSTFINNQDITLNQIGDYSNVNINAIIYYFPLSILTRAPLGIDDVKKLYRTKIEIKEKTEIYDFLKSIENTTYTIKDYDYIDIRCVVEFFNNDLLIFNYSIDVDKNIIIDNHMINNGNEFIIFVTKYLDAEYLQDFYE
jgi:hypothetical protein